MQKAKLRLKFFVIFIILWVIAFFIVLFYPLFAFDWSFWQIKASFGKSVLFISVGVFILCGILWVVVKIISRPFNNKGVKLSDNTLPKPLNYEEMIQSKKFEVFEDFFDSLTYKTLEKYFSKYNDLSIAHIDEGSDGVEIIYDDRRKVVSLFYNGYTRECLTSFPEEFTQLEDLTHLWVQNCAFKTVPDSITNLHNLKILDLDDNKIEYVPESICDLESLENLRLTNNLISRNNLLSIKNKCYEKGIKFGF